MENLYNALVDNIGVIHELPILEDTAWLTIEEQPVNIMPQGELTLLINEVLDYE